MDSDQVYGELVAILGEAIDLVNRPETDLAWSSWSQRADAVAELAGHADRLSEHDDSKVRELMVLFLPTGDLQEASISSGWSEEYLDLSARFDSAIKRLPPPSPASSQSS